MALKESSRRKRKELSPRQMKLIKARAEGKTYKQAAIEAGYSSKHAAQNGYQALSQIRGRVQDLLDRQGLDENTAIEKYLKPLLEARETVFFQKNGKVTATRKVEALAIRLNALKELFLLHGSYAPRDPKEAAQFGIKVVVVDIPRPPRNAIDVTPRVAGGNDTPPKPDNNGHD
jgi:CCR4-NOT transcriptional regulation complex NOT5 subunit